VNICLSNGGTTRNDRGAGMGERMYFLDPLDNGEPPGTAPPKKTSAVPAPPSETPSAPQAVPSQGREREVQQLIHDLAVLAVKHQTRKPSPCQAEPADKKRP
jgi:hypothetical protein